MALTDTHTHLYLDDFNSSRDELIEKAIQKGVGKFYLPNIDSSTIQTMLALEKQYPERMFAMIGLHPCSVKNNWQDEIRIVEQWLAMRPFVAIGEMGIDLFWDKSFFEEQKRAFIRQVELANKYKRPIVIHSRDSFEEIYRLLLEVPKEPPYGIFHCFTGNEEQAKRAIDLGFSLGIGGVLTFKNSGLDKVVEKIDIAHLVLETDAPYLAPTPHRGKINIPAYLSIIAEKLAMVKKMSVQDVADITSENARKIFAQFPTVT